MATKKENARARERAAHARTQADRQHAVAVSRAKAGQMRTRFTPGASAQRPGQPDGVTVSIGPLGSHNRQIKDWMTFPLTPESIPISTSASYQDGVFAVVGDEESQFAGANLDSISFQGILEPPAFYEPIGKATLADLLAGNVFAGDFEKPDGIVDPAQQFALSDDVRTQAGNDSVGAPQFASGTGVVMQEGAHAGRNFFEPHIFADKLRKACKQGEKIRLVIGDQYGFNGRVTIRDFEWRYEDPDPDTLYFTISFKQAGSDTGLTVAGKKKSSPGQGRARKPKAVVTGYGETLQKIAIRELHNVEKSAALVRYNRKLLEALWLYPTGIPAGQNARQTIGNRIKGRTDGHKLGALIRVEQFPPDLPFRDGVRLQVSAPGGDRPVVTGSRPQETTRS